MSIARCRSWKIKNMDMDTDTCRLVDESFVKKRGNRRVRDSLTTRKDVLSHICYSRFKSIINNIYIILRVGNELHIVSVRKDEN